MILLASPAWGDSTLPGAAAGETAPRCTDALPESEPLYAEGLRHYRDKRMIEARRSWLLLIKDKPLSPFLPDVFLHFGDYYLAEGQVDNALKFYDKVLQYPKLRCAPSVHLQRAHAFFNQENYQNAMMSFISALDTRDPSVALRARRGLVLAFARVGQPAKARAFFMRVAPDHVDEMLGWLADARGR